MKKLLLVILVLSVASICYAADETEEITLTTYYPAPYGTYEQLQSNMLAIGSGAAMPTDDGVISFEPRDEPTGVAEGDIYYNSVDHEFKYHDNSNWNSLAAGGVPSGTVVAFAGSTAPSEWLLCNGAAVSRSTYSNLLAAIGTTYGSGDGSTTFNLPDLRGVFIRGLNTGIIGHDPNRALGSYQEDEFKSHTHFSRGNEDLGSLPGIAAITDYVNDRQESTPSGGLETRPKNVAMNYIIKT